MHVSGLRGSLEPTRDRKRQLHQKFADYYSRSFGFARINDTGAKPYSCKECGKTSSESKWLSCKAHENSHSCKQCGKTFTRSDTYPCKSHENSHREKPYSCKECGKTISDVTDLQVTWQLTQERGRPYSHRDCGKTFSQGSPLYMYMSRYMRIHTRKNQYRCKACGKGFPVLLSLGRHLQTCLRRGTSRQPVKRVCREKHSSRNHMLSLSKEQRV